MSKTLLGKNILRNCRSKGSFLDQLQSVHAVADSSPAARWTQSQINLRFAQASEQGSKIGYAEGYMRGEAKGMEIGLENGISQVRQEVEASNAEEIAAFAQELQLILNQTKNGIDQWYQQAEERLAALALEIAQRAIGNALVQNSEAVIQIAHQVLNEVTSGSQVRLRVNPIQSATLESHKEQIIQAISHIREIEIVSDPSIQNGVIVESETGVTDARVESYLQRLADHITGEAA